MLKISAVMFLQLCSLDRFLLYFHIVYSKQSLSLNTMWGQTSVPFPVWYDCLCTVLLHTWVTSATTMSAFSISLGLLKSFETKLFLIWPFIMWFLAYKILYVISLQWRWILFYMTYKMPLYHWWMITKSYYNYSSLGFVSSMYFLVAVTHMTLSLG